jgi:mannonate dehydratase
MKDNRRDFIKKNASSAAALSLGSAAVSGITGRHTRNFNSTQSFKPLSETNYIKDAAMKMCLAYFAGKEPRKMELAKQMGFLGAVGGIVSPAIVLSEPCLP